MTCCGCGQVVELTNSLQPVMVILTECVIVAVRTHRRWVG